MAILIYSNTCPKCRLIRRILGALNIFGHLQFIAWDRAVSSILLEYFDNEDEVPYNFMLLDDDESLHIGGPAIPLIMIRLWQEDVPKVLHKKADQANHW